MKLATLDSFERVIHSNGWKYVKGETQVEFWVPSKTPELIYRFVASRAHGGVVLRGFSGVILDDWKSIGEKILEYMLSRNMQMTPVWVDRDGECVIRSSTYVLEIEISIAIYMLKMEMDVLTQALTSSADNLKRALTAAPIFGGSYT